MTIKEVEQKTGLSRSNIRFYEKEKLLNPVRNERNGYREYSFEDIFLLRFHNGCSGYYSHMT